MPLDLEHILSLFCDTLQLAIEHILFCDQFYQFQVITCLSETPEGRRILLDHLDVVSTFVPVEQFADALV